MLAAGAEHTAAVTENGKLYGWGWGRYGNLGLGDRNDRLVPAEVPALPGELMTMVACGWRHTITVSGSGSLYTYGWSKYGQLGQGDYNDHLLPHQVEALRNKRIVQISGGWRHTVALSEQGKVYSWGWNKFGQLGVGDANNRCAPQLVQIPEDQIVMQVSCGWRHTVAITDGYNVFSWGRGTSGQLGHGDILDRSIPKRIESLSADGFACQHIESPQLSGAGAHWISPSERYAVVPDEMVSSLSGRLHQTANVVEETVVPSISASADADASVPDTDFKRPRNE
ncbi:hypothetical protein O6H91_Y228200 [Diphasiastrum complanatum]|nr:hypothetical protein O6H91_Y228200 [Diphasiastrum complanatum]